MKYFISRHPGAIDWASQQSITDVELINQFDTAVVQPGDLVMGILPINLIAEVIARGGRYMHLSMSVPVELRGVELTADQMVACNAKLEEFTASLVTTAESA